MQTDIAIIVVAYNRPKALNRLLSSLCNAYYDSYKNISLIISIDYSGRSECADLAHNFNWIHGTKKVIHQQENLGLKKHILQCGDLSSEHDAVILLEDDLFVSPAFYDYAHQAFSFYKDDKNIAGIGLYNYRFNEVAFCPFEPIADGYDNYFMQVPCSWGQLWTKEQWKLFKNYAAIERPEEDALLPAAIAFWPSATSWKKIFYRYLIFTNRYFVYPCISLTTNFGDTGQHHDKEMLVWQTPLLLNRKVFNFSKLSNSTSVYDAFFELDTKAFNNLTNQNLDICIDVNGSKNLSQIKTKYLLSSKKCKRSVKKYALNLYPYINNVLMGMEDAVISANYFSLGATNSFIDELNVDTRYLDARRIFFDEGLLLETGKNEIKKLPAYVIGYNILKPYNFIKHRLRRIKKNKNE